MSHTRLDEQGHVLVPRDHNKRRLHCTQGLETSDRSVGIDDRGFFSGLLTQQRALQVRIQRLDLQRKVRFRRVVVSATHTRVVHSQILLSYTYREV